MTTVVMPQLGESVMEGTVVRWIARPGQKVERDEPLVEIATDKANTEIPSPSSGVLVEQLAKEGADVTSYLEKGATSSQQSEMQPPLSTFPGQKAPTAPPVYSMPPPPPSFGPGYQGFGPVQITLRAYKPARYTPKEGDQVIPFDQRRRLIAEHMVYSKATSPHVPCTAEVDMTNLGRLRGEWKRSKETGGKAPSFLVGLCRATVHALAEFPLRNAVVQDESIILRKDVNLGVAVETEKGLLVPVIRKANELSVLGL